MKPPPGEWVRVLPHEVCVYDELGEMGIVSRLIPIINRMEYEVFFFPKFWGAVLDNDALPSAIFRYQWPARQEMRVFRPEYVPGERRLATA